MVQTDVKRSKFFAYIAPTKGAAAAKTFINEIRQLHPQASHNCWAYVASRPENSVEIGYSDDGEPSGCAGRPMLNVLQGSGIGEITVVVSRYFGGTKLGTGGMARAYGGAVSAVLAEAVTHQETVRCAGTLVSNYAWSSLVEQLVAKFEVQIISVNYLENISYQFAIDTRCATDFAQCIHQGSNGQLVVKIE